MREVKDELIYVLGRFGFFGASLMPDYGPSLNEEGIRFASRIEHSRPRLEPSIDWELRDLGGLESLLGSDLARFREQDVLQLKPGLRP